MGDVAMGDVAMGDVAMGDRGRRWAISDGRWAMGDWRLAMGNGPVFIGHIGDGVYVPPSGDGFYPFLWPYCPACLEPGG